MTAGIAEVSVERKTGRIRVHSYWIASDAGLIVQPENSSAQLESAVVYGLSAALTEELTVKAGAIRETNFHQYRVLRMADMPEIHTKLVVTDNSPTGMGSGRARGRTGNRQRRFQAYRGARAAAADDSRARARGAERRGDDQSLDLYLGRSPARVMRCITLR